MEPPSSHSISVLNPAGYPISPERTAQAVSVALASGGAPYSNIRVLITDDAEVQRLNREFRAVNEPTDVLTFPEGEACSGDIAISFPFAARQAAAREIHPEDEVAWLAIHGALHLLGLNDESASERAEMIRRMNAAGAAMGLAPENDWSSIHEVAS